MKKLWKICLLTLLLCTALSSCGEKEESPAQTTETTQTTTETEAVTTAAPEPLTVFANGKSEYKIVRSGKVNGVEQNLFLQFYLQMDQRSGCKFAYIEDTIAFNKAPDPTAKEILLGMTNREESIALMDKLNALGGNHFGITVGEHKIAIVGTDSYQTFLGLDYLMTNFIQADETGIPVMYAEAGFEYISEGNNNSTPFDLVELRDSGRGFIFAMTERVIRVPSVEGSSIMQGGGTDGKYAYYALIDKSTATETAVISKYDLDTMDLVMTSKVLPTGHTNDITYDSKNNRLAISSGLDGWRGTIFLDPDTLEIIDHQVAPIGNRGMEYLPSTDQYIIANGYTIYTTDAALNPISSFTCQNPQYTTQGLTCDEKFVYDVRYNNAGGTHYIVIHDMQGNYIGSARLAGINYEPENLIIHNGEFYLGCNQSNSVYHLELTPEYWW
jgi:hypothetical protein